MGKLKGILVVVGLLAVVVVGVIIAVSKAPDRPILAVSVRRVCDFLDFAGGRYCVCTDGTRWVVSELNPSTAPVIAPVSGFAAQGVSAVSPEGTSILARYSHYWPPLGGPNCALFVGGECLSKTASGEPWQTYIDVAVACPPEWPFGTRVYLDGREWVCLDRGGSVQYQDGVPWVDFLTEKGTYDYGELVTIQLVAGSTDSLPRAVR